MAFGLVHDVGPKLQERLLIAGIGTTFTVFPDDTVFGYSCHCCNHTETCLRCHILHLQQRIVVGTVAEDGHHHTLCPVGIHHAQTFYSQCGHTPGKDRQGNDNQVILMDFGQLDVSGLDSQVGHRALCPHATA